LSPGDCKITPAEGMSVGTEVGAIRGSAGLVFFSNCQIVKTKTPKIIAPKTISHFFLILKLFCSRPPMRFGKIHNCGHRSYFFFFVDGFFINGLKRVPATILLKYFINSSAFFILDFSVRFDDFDNLLTYF